MNAAGKQQTPNYIKHAYPNLLNPIL